MNNIEDRVKMIQQDYQRYTWWKSDMMYRPIDYRPTDIVSKPIYITVDTPVNEINDLLTIVKKYPILPNITYSIRMDRLHAIYEPLNKLNNMVGMTKVKTQVIDQILYYLQDLHCVSVQSSDYLHTVLSGGPGTGKTEVAKILGDIFRRLAILSKGTFRKATRDDFIAGYLGQTSLKTKDLIRQTQGGVLFIDEAYALGHTDKRDSYAKEAIDTINEALSDVRQDWMVIIAGYQTELDECFFSYNPGLPSRFPWRYELDDYNGAELRQIFEKMAREQGWTCVDLQDSWFEQKRVEYFKDNGRDMETLLVKTKIAYGRRRFGKPAERPPVITQDILESGFAMYCQHRPKKEKRVLSMYL